MKNKKGFTLIELLAVIVILAIIALIATPIILNMITKARKNAARSSALGYIDAIEYNNGFASIGTEGYTEIKSGDVTEIDVKLKGQKPTSGTITVDKDGRVTKAENLCINGYIVNYDGQDATVGSKCNGESTPTVQPKSFEDDDWDTIAANTTSDKYKVGDEKTVNIDIDGDGTKEEYHLVIVNNTTPSECSIPGYSQTACGFVLQFKEQLNITNKSDNQMNTEYTNVGGWPACKMYTYLNSTSDNNSVYNKLKTEIGNIIIDTKTISGHGKTSGETNFVSVDKLYLLSTVEIGLNEPKYETVISETRKLDYYTNASSRIKYKYGTDEAKDWWLRSAFADDALSFSASAFNGSYHGIASYGNYGVAPAFRIGKNISNKKSAYFNDGPTVNVMMKKLAGTNASNETTVDTNITAIKHSTTKPNTSNMTNDNIVSAVGSDYPIYMWYNNGIIYWYSEDDHPYLNIDASYMFNNLSNLTDISGLENFNTKYTTSLMSTFWKDTSLSNISPIKNWNISNVTTLRSTFHTTNISNLNALKNWDTSKVTIMFRTFDDNDNSLQDASGINKWNISNVTDFSNMFGIYTSSSTTLNPVHPTFEDSNGNPIPGTWSSNGTFTKS